VSLFCRSRAQRFLAFVSQSGRCQALPRGIGVSALLPRDPSWPAPFLPVPDRLLPVLRRSFFKRLPRGLAETPMARWLCSESLRPRGSPGGCDRRPGKAVQSRSLGQSAVPQRSFLPLGSVPLLWAMRSPQRLFPVICDREFLSVSVLHSSRDGIVALWLPSQYS
jgi:hypothetical protein